MEVIRHDQFPEEYFCKLEVLELVHFPSDYVNFPSDFLQRFTNLEYLAVNDASFEEIVLHEVMNCGKKLAGLKNLKLSRLPRLQHLSNEDSQPCPIFQNLEELEVVECGRLKMLVPSSMSFQCLTNLEVSNCHGLMNLMTTSAAKHMVQLTEMAVTECDMVEEIVVNEEHEAENEVVFPKLKYLELSCLPNVTSFHFENCAFTFPSLEVVVVKECPKMKIFSQGIISTPELETVITERDLRGYLWEDDLNSTIQKLFTETGNGVAQSKLPSSSKQSILACDAGEAKKDGLSVVSGGQSTEVLLVTETPGTIKNLPSAVEMIRGTNKGISKGGFNDKEDSKRDQSSPISMSSETQVCLQVQKVSQVTNDIGFPQDKVMPASSVQKSGYTSHAVVGEIVPVSSTTFPTKTISSQELASCTDSMPASETSSVDLIMEKSYSPADFESCIPKNLPSDFDATTKHLTEENVTRSAVAEHENSQLVFTYQDFHGASNDKKGEPSQEQATPGSSIQQSNPVSPAIAASKDLPHNLHNASKDKEDPTECRNSQTAMDTITHISQQFEKDRHEIAKSVPSQEQVTPDSLIQQSNPISPSVAVERDATSTPELERVTTERDLTGYFWEDDLNSTIQKLFAETGNGVTQSKLPSSSKQPILACDVGEAKEDEFTVVSGGQAAEVLLVTEAPEVPTYPTTSVLQAPALSCTSPTTTECSQELMAFSASRQMQDISTSLISDRSSLSHTDFETLIISMEQMLHPSSASSSQPSSSSNSRYQSHESISVSFETYSHSMARMKKILEKSPTEVASSADCFLLLSTLMNLRNCHLLNSQQLEIIQVYIDNFDSLVTNSPSYEQQIDSTSALKLAMKENKNRISELMSNYEDLTRKSSTLSANKQALKRKLQEIEVKEARICDDMDVLRAQLMTRKEKLETHMKVLPEAEGQQREAVERASNVNDNWAKIRSLFA